MKLRQHQGLLETAQMHRHWRGRRRRDSDCAQHRRRRDRLRVVHGLVSPRNQQQRGPSSAAWRTTWPPSSGRWRKPGDAGDALRASHGREVGTRGPGDTRTVAVALCVRLWEAAGTGRNVCFLLDYVRFTSRSRSSPCGRDLPNGDLELTPVSEPRISVNRP